VDAPVGDDRLSRIVSIEVKVWMARRGMGQQALADQLGISRQALSARLTGRTQWTVDDLAAAAAALDVPVADLLTSPKR
jgi:transcriptional regulator with XRE-family HTH domain